MADVINLGQRVSSVDVSPQFQPYSKVIIHINDDEAVEVGNNTGQTLEFDNPFGSREMAQNILNRLSGYQYQPYQADGALLDPAAEIGDAVGTATSYGGLFTRSRKFGRLMKADISAPHDEEINHEFKYESPQERKFTRVTGEIRASLILTNNKIEAEVVNREAQGAELSSRITLTATQLSSEIINRQNADSEMSSRITQTANSLESEITNRENADNTLSSRITQTDTKIETEVSRATRAEGNLSSRITQTNTKIETEVSRATRAEGKLSSRITQTDSAISTEVSRATNAEGNLSTRITQNANGITAEVRRATQAEGNLQSSLSIQASEIAAKVSASGGGGSFSWVLNSNSHTWKSNGTDVMRVSASGLWLKGNIEATSGKIGNFNIGSNAIWNNISEFGGSQTFGVYVGTDGIQLGQEFKVSSDGRVDATNLYATDMALLGTLWFKDDDDNWLYINANSLRQGAQQSYNNYNSWNGTTSTVNSNRDHWTNGANGGIDWNNAQSSSTTSRPNVFMRHCDCYSFACSDYVYAANGFRTGYFTATWRTAYVKDQNGNNMTLYYLGR